MHVSHAHRTSPHPSRRPPLALAAAIVLLSPLLPVNAHAFRWAVDGTQLVATQPSLALDASDNVHLALRSSTGTIRYAKRVGGVYQPLETVDATTNRGIPVLALDGGGTPHMVYPTGSVTSPRYLYYSRRVGANQWRGFVNNSPDLIATIDAYTTVLALATDAGGNPHVLYYVNGTQQLLHTWYTGSAWTTEQVFQASFAQSPSIAFDGAGALHVAFGTGTQLRYQVKPAGGTWGTYEVIASVQGAVPSLALTSAGVPCVAYSANVKGLTRLYYNTRTGGAWNAIPELVDPATTIGIQPILKLQDGLARITYWDKPAYDVRAAWQCASGWNLYTVDASPTAPGGSVEPGPACLALTANNAPIVYYTDVVNARTKSAAATAPAAATGVANAFGVSTTATSWTVPDDGGVIDCTPSRGYELRVASSAINTEAKWNSATILAQGFADQGTSVCVEQTSLPSCTNYYFAVKHTDQFGLVSAISNSPGGKTRCTGSIEVACGASAKNMMPQDEGLADLTPALAIEGANPARRSTRMSFSVPSGYEGRQVEFGIFDLSGRLVRNLTSGGAQSGLHEVTWNLDDGTGRRVPNGVYFARLVLGSEVYKRTLVVMSP